MLQQMGTRVCEWGRGHTDTHVSLAELSYTKLHQFMIRYKICSLQRRILSFYIGHRYIYLSFIFP
jgi:hypothetical protein